MEPYNFVEVQAPADCVSAVYTVLARRRWAFSLIYIGGLAQDSGNSSTLAMQSFAKPLIWYFLLSIWKTEPVNQTMIMIFFLLKGTHDVSFFSAEAT